MTKIKFSQVAHLYLGCQIKVVKTMPYGLGWTEGSIAEMGRDLLWDMGDTVYEKGKIIGTFIDYFKPILRPLSSMTEAELQECGNMIYDFSDDPELNNHQWKDFEVGLFPEQLLYLLSKGFDLFGLIKSGEAIDATKIEQ